MLRGNVKRWMPLLAAEPGGRVRLGAQAGRLALFAALFLIFGLVSVRGGWSVFTRPLWLDEVHTYLVAGTQSLPESLRSLGAGADFNPPTVFLLYRVAGVLAGGLSELTMRIVAAACVVGALGTVYALLRDQFSPELAAVGAISVWAQPVVVEAAFEARFYGPWLFASGCLLLTLLRVTRGTPTCASGVSLAFASIAVCTVHYFGVLSWAVALAYALLAAPGSRAALVRQLAPALAGPLALAACMPLYLGQRAALSVPTWIPAVSVTDAAFLLAAFLLPMPTLIAVACWGLAQADRGRAGRPGPSKQHRALSLGPGLLLTQAVIPVVLVAVSLLVQPATQPRYWIVGAFAAAPVVALAISRAGLVLGVAGTLAILVSSRTSLRAEVVKAETLSRRVKEDTRVASELSNAGQLVVARRRHTLYPVVHERPELRSRIALLDATAIHKGDTFAAVERDVARVHLRRYGFPRLVTPADLGAVQSFYLIELDTTSTPTSQEFPRHSMSKVGERVYHLELRDREGADLVGAVPASPSGH